MKKILLLAIVMLNAPAFAMSKAELCSFRAQFVESFAQSRDKGKSQQQTITETREMFKKKFGPNAIEMKTLKTYVQMVYKFKEFTPRQMRDVTEMSCLKED